MISPSGSPQPYNGGSPVVGPDAIFFNRFGAGRTTAIFRWVAPGPQEPWRVEPDPGTKAASSFATDGKDMVWLENGFGDASAPSDLSIPFTHRYLVTAKYGEKGAPVDPRQLTRDPGVYATDYAVYCGHAARLLEADKPDGTRYQALFLVRLTDGRNWTLESTGFEPPTQRWSWLGAVALTCDEIMVGVVGPTILPAPSASTIVRVRLDSLGPGRPAE
ncbi:MAG: hypothetical protein IT374_09275 [Polyangiaceae bacterium]|nr:hypothetical protein [Polyangiaceae bacterium]